MSAQTQMAQKTSVLFGKTGPAIYHSHHDIIRFWERAVKRAAIPVRLTQGFNPRPRIIFPHALGVGIASNCEEVELELADAMPIPDILERLRHAAGDTLEILEARNLPPVKKSRQLVSSTYAVGGWPTAAATALIAAADDILAMAEIPVERGAPGNKRRLDARPFLAELAYDNAANLLRMKLRHSQAGGGRPDEIVKLVAGRLGLDWRDHAIQKNAMVLE